MASLSKSIRTLFISIWRLAYARRVVLSWFWSILTKVSPLRTLSPTSTYIFSMIPVSDGEIFISSYP